MSTTEKRKCFTFTWTLENLTYCWQKPDGFVSPAFLLNRQEELKYHLILYPYGIMDKTRMRVFLDSTTDHNLNKINCELAFVSKDGAELKSGKCNDSCLFIEREEVLFIKRSVYLSEDSLTIRCRMWMKEGELVDDVHTFARTRICIKKETFLWNIQNFSSLHSEQKCTYQIKSIVNNEVLMDLDLSLDNPFTEEDSITIRLVSENGAIKYCVLHLIPLNGFGSTYKGIRKEFLFSENKKSKLFNLPFSKRKLMANKSICLPNDVLSLQCECTYSTGAITEEMESVVYGKVKHIFSTSEISNFFKDYKYPMSTSKRIFNENLKSLLTDNIHSDIKLKTGSETISAHKNILGARSPVFKEMFSNNIAEIYDKCVYIEDLDSDTVHRMLQFIYTAEFNIWQWKDAFDLYIAADKYKIISLKDECSHYLKSNLSPDNACAVLILADLYQDEDLKVPVQEFIFKHDLLNSEGWKRLMKIRVKLATDTMHFQIHRKSSEFPTDINMKSAMIPFTVPKTTTASFGLNSNTINMPSTSKQFFFSTTEKYSSFLLGNRDLNSFINPFFSFGSSSSENVFVDKLPLVSGNDNKEPVSIPFSFVGNSYNVPVNSSFSVANNSGKEPAKPFVSFSSSDELTVKPSFSVSVCSEKEPDKASFPSGSNNEKEPHKASFPFGSGNEQEPDKASFPSGSSNEQEPDNTSFQTGSSEEKEPDNTSLQTGSSEEKEPDKAFFPFGSNREEAPANTSVFRSSNKEPFRIPFSFFSQSENKSVKSSLLFGKIREKEPARPSFSFGNYREKEAVNPSFPFFDSNGNDVNKLSCSDKKKPVKRFFSNSNDKKLNAHSSANSIAKRIKSCFSFGCNNEKEPVKSSFSFDSSCVKAPAGPFSLFSGYSKEEPFSSQFSFVSNNEKDSVKPSFSFCKNSEEKRANYSFPWGSNSEKESGKPTFSFENKIVKEPVKLSFLFANCDDKMESVKSSFLLQNSSKESVESSFFLGRGDEKKPVKKSFSFSNSCTKALSPSPRFNSDTKKIHLKCLVVDNSSAVTTCEAIRPASAEMHSTHHMFDNPNVKTSSALFVFNNTNGETLASSEIGNSIRESTGTNEICSSVVETSSSNEIGNFIVETSASNKIGSSIVETSSTSDEIGSSIVETSATSNEIGSSIVKTSIASNVISSNITVESSPPFLLLDSVGEIASFSSFGFNGNNGATCFDSLASNTSSVEIPASPRLLKSSSNIQSNSGMSNKNKCSSSETSEVISTRAKKPSVSSG